MIGFFNHLANKASFCCFLSLVLLFHPSRRELREQMGRVHRLVHGFGLFQAARKTMRSGAPNRVKRRGNQKTPQPNWQTEPLGR